THVHRHTNGESSQQNHSKNYPGGDYSAAAAHLRTSSNDLHRDLLHRGQRTCAGGHTLRPDSFVNPISVCYLAHLNNLRVPFAVQICSGLTPAPHRRRAIPCPE